MMISQLQKGDGKLILLMHFPLKHLFYSYLFYSHDVSLSPRPKFKIPHGIIILSIVLCFLRRQIFATIVLKSPSLHASLCYLGKIGFISISSDLAFFFPPPHTAGRSFEKR